MCAACNFEPSHFLRAGAFFDMYIGDSPVSLEAKREVARNVAGLMGRCGG
uniref:Uncharacterized protein n=1 Tax=Aegilops tauschii subsp. strangulata TaxID=200361 RepID=A0A453R273_AEGTS